MLHCIMGVLRDVRKNRLPIGYSKGNVEMQFTEIKRVDGDKNQLSASIVVKRNNNQETVSATLDWDSGDKVFVVDAEGITASVGDSDFLDVTFTLSSLSLEKTMTLKADSSVELVDNTQPPEEDESVELFYKLVDDDGNSVIETLDFIDIQATTAYKGIGAVLLTDRDFNQLPNTKLVFEGKRLVSSNPYSGFEFNEYAEKAFLQVENGDSVEFSTVYTDAGIGFATEIPFVDYPIQASTGVFKPFNVARITFDNNGTIFSENKAFSRKITFY